MPTRDGEKEDAAIEAEAALDGFYAVCTRTEVTDALHEAFGFCTSKEIIPIKR